MNLRPAEDGHGLAPDFPKNVGFGLLADLRQADWGLYEFTPDDGEAWTPPHPVSCEVEAAIESGRRFPPALALARYDVQRKFANELPSQDEFAASYAALIRQRLSQQPQVPFLLARVLRTVDIDKVEDEWYWVLAVRGEPPVVSWVSDDYFVYDAPVADFDLADDQIARLRAG